MSCRVEEEYDLTYSDENKQTSDIGFPQSAILQESKRVLVWKNGAFSCEQMETGESCCLSFHICIFSWTLLFLHPVRKRWSFVRLFLWMFVLGVWTFLWFVCFCLLASQWSKTPDDHSIPKDAARATIAFSFFSIATWVSGIAALI